MTVQSLADIHELAQQLRVDSIRCSTSAGSGHPTSSMSAADLMAVLMARHFRYDWQQPDNPANDHLIFSKGHASPLLYSMFKAAGVVTDEELMNGYRRFGSRLEGHPTPVLPWVDVATGSLGQGLPDGVGVALAGKYLDELPYRVWVLCGDSETAEGSIWEALDKASHYGLSNLTAIIDVNRLGQRGPTELSWDTDTYAKRVEAFGCHAVVIDGHDLGEIDKAFTGAAGADRPTVVVARTRKGRGFDEVEDRENWHGKPLPEPMAERAIIELGGQRDIAGHRAEAGRRDTPGLAQRRGEPAPIRAGRQGRHPAGVRSGAGRGRRPRRRRRHGRRGGQLHAHGGVLQGVSREVLRDVHRRAAARRRRCRPAGPRVRAIRLHVRRVLHPRLRLHPDVGDLPGEHPAVRVPLRRRDRRGRPVADGPGGPGHDARRARLDGPVPQRPQQHGVPGGADGRDRRHRLHAHHPRRLPGPVRGGRGIPDRRFEGHPGQCGRPGDAHRRRA